MNLPIKKVMRRNYEILRDLPGHLAERPLTEKEELDYYCGLGFPIPRISLTDWAFDPFRPRPDYSPDRIVSETLKIMRKSIALLP